MAESENHWRWRTHSGWLIAILLAIICWLVIETPQGSEIRDYVGFASSIAALILAMIAIFQAIIAQQSSAESAASLKDSMLEIRTAASDITRTSKVLLDKQQDVIGHVVNVPQRISEFMETINEQSVSISGSDLKLQNANNSSFIGEQCDIIEKVKGAPLGMRVSVAALALSILNDKIIDMHHLYSDEGERVYNHWINGALQAIRILRPWNIDISAVSDVGTMVFQVTDSGSFNPSEFIEYIETIKADEPEIWDGLFKYSDENKE